MSQREAEVPWDYYVLWFFGLFYFQKAIMQQIDMTQQQQLPNDPQAQAIGEYPYAQDQMVEPQKPVDVVAQLNAQLETANIADGMDKSRLATIGRRVIDDYESDKDSRADWEREQTAISKIAEMNTETKMWAGKVVSNVKFPMIMSAAIHYASRSYPEIVKGRDVVKCAVVGKDVGGTKSAKANRVGAHMSYQLLEEMDWESELDQLLMMYAISGSEFKKTYYCPIKERNVSELVMAKDLVVNYWAKSIDTAARITHTIELSKNDIIERLNAGVFRSDLTIEDFGNPEQNQEDAITTTNDEDSPHSFLEQHRWLDLDDDGYQEPYIATVHKQSATVVRICARYDIDGIKMDDQGRILKIEPVNYFTHFKFMPSTDGGFYGVGFGKLLFGINAAINAITNQLIDAGTANNRMSGFIGRGVQIGPAAAKTDGFVLAPGDWKAIPSTGDDVRKNIVPMPSKEPSAVLFQMLQFLIETGKELSSVSDILSGESPGANVPAASTLALIEQGLKVFSGTFKRLYRSLKEEFKKIARLNRLYLPEESYFAVLDDDMAIFQEDYSETSLDIVPVADPSNLSDMGRAMKMQAMMQLIGQGFNDDAIRKRYLQSLNIENSEELLPPENAGPPPIPPDVQASIDKLNAETEKLKVETVTAAVTSQFSAMQAANVIATTPTTAPIADALLLSAGFVDKNTPPIVPQNVIQQPGLPAMPQNTSPLFPATPTNGMMQGIETPANDMGMQQ